MCIFYVYYITLSLCPWLRVFHRADVAVSVSDDSQWSSALWGPESSTHSHTFPSTWTSTNTQTSQCRTSQRTCEELLFIKVTALFLTQYAPCVCLCWMLYILQLANSVYSRISSVSLNPAHSDTAQEVIGHSQSESISNKSTDEGTEQSFSISLPVYLSICLTACLSIYPSSIFCTLGSLCAVLNHYNIHYLCVCVCTVCLYQAQIRLLKWACPEAHLTQPMGVS